MADTDIVILDSAYKHGVTEQSIRSCLYEARGGELIGYPPPKRILAGFDHMGNPIELGVVGDEETGRMVIFHAMKLRKQYYYLLHQEGGNL